MSYATSLANLKGIREAYRMKIEAKKPTTWEASNLYQRDIATNKDIYLKNTIFQSIDNYSSAVTTIKNNLPANYTKTASNLAALISNVSTVKTSIEEIFTSYVDDASKKAFEEGTTEFTSADADFKSTLTTAEGLLDKVNEYEKNALKAHANNTTKEDPISGRMVPVAGTYEGHDEAYWKDAALRIEREKITPMLDQLKSLLEEIETKYILADKSQREVGTP